MRSAFFVFLWYCSTGARQCQHFFEKNLYISPGAWHTKGVHSTEKEVLNMAKNKNQNQNQNQNQNKNGKNENQEQNKQAKECN